MEKTDEKKTYSRQNAGFPDLERAEGAGATHPGRTQTQASKSVSAANSERRNVDRNKSGAEMTEGIPTRACSHRGSFRSFPGRD